MGTTTRPWMRIEASGEPYIVVIDPDGTQPIGSEELTGLLTLGSDAEAPQSTPVAAVVRAVRSQSTPEGAKQLREEPEAHWFCDAVTRTGEPITTSGNAVRVLVEALIFAGLHTVRDRRESISVATPDGVRDVLPGRAGYAADMGRWRIVGQPTPTIFLIQVGRVVTGVKLIKTLTTTRSLDTFVATETFPEVNGWVLASPKALEIQQGIASTQITAFASDGSIRASSSHGAIAAALVLRHVSAPDTPHHWSIRTSGGSLGVRIFPTEEGEHVSVSGPVKIIAHESRE